MQVQRELWATEALPESLTIKLERAWLTGPDVVVLGAAAKSTKGEHGVWMAGEAYEGDSLELVMPEAVGAIVARWMGPRWAERPRLLTADQWRTHLLTF